MELQNLPTVLSLSQFSTQASLDCHSDAFERDEDEEEAWRPSVALAKEFRRICFYSDARVVLTSSAKVRFGRVLFKRRLCKRKRVLSQGDILSFLKKNGRCCRVPRL